MLATRSGNVVNGCITNTCIQVANNPVRIAISVLNSNYTCDLIKESGIFTLSLLDQTCSFETIRHFGFQSGRDVDKFANITAPADENAVPLPRMADLFCSQRKSSFQTGSWNTYPFIAEVTDAKLLSDNPPLTYADYQAHVKPKPEQKKEDKKIIGWRCKICNYVYEGSNLPEEFTCPLCGHGADDFEPIYENA